MDVNYTIYSLCLHFLFCVSRFAFATASPDNIKQWKFPDGNFLQNLSGHQAILNSIAVNSDNVLVSGGMSLFSENLVRYCLLIKS